MANDFSTFPVTTARCATHFASGGHHGTFVVQIVVFAVGAHHAQDGDALGHFDAELAARGLVALHLVDEGMLGKFALQGLGAHAFQVFPNGADAFLFQQGSYFLLRDEAGIYRVFLSPVPRLGTPARWACG